MKWLVIGLMALTAYWGLNRLTEDSGMRDFDSASLNVAMKDPAKIVVVEYYSETSEQCRDLSAKFEKIADRYSSQAIIGILDIEKHPRFANSKMEGVTKLPYTQVYLKGKMVEHFTGSKSEEELRSIVLRHSEKL